MARGLAAAHENGVVHRDLKPGNVWITKEEGLKILDFGLSKRLPSVSAALDSVSPTGTAPGSLTKQGTILGTVGYMSPEQVRGESVDARSDLFSFGVVFYEMLTGRRAFARSTVADTMAAILKEDPAEELHGSRSIPVGLQRLVGHCLEKDTRLRFESARDLSFALESALGESGQYEPAHGPPSGWRRRSLLGGVASGWRRRSLLGGVAGLLLLALALSWIFRKEPEQPSAVAIRLVTYSGHDTSPAVSPDGKTIAFTSDRDGQPRIWLKQMKGGGEVALTTGPDDYPRFSPDGTTVLYIHSQDGGTSLDRITLLGSDPHKIVDNAEQADWSPDGKQIAFVRFDRTQDRALSVLFLIEAAGGGERELARFEGELVGFPRWSPDGRHIIVNTPIIITSGVQRKLFLVDVKGGVVQEIQSESPALLSSAVWLSSEEIIYLQSESITQTAVRPARAFREDIRTRGHSPLFWVASSGTTVDLFPDGRVIFDSMSGRQNLREYPLDGHSPPRWMTHGAVIDRQPVFAPRDDWVVFSSNRSGNLDLWAVFPRSGVVRSLTDDPADDWDPGFSPDGRSLLWSSNRSGNLEIWSSNPDGTAAHQVTHDGVDAQNPTETRDGKWIVYSSANRAHTGLCKIHPDGSGAELLVHGRVQMPEVSPDGTYATYAIIGPSTSFLHVVRVEDGVDTIFSVLPEPRRKTAVQPGRSRWTPDGKRILFAAQDETGLDGVFIQDFVPGKDTQATRRPLTGFDPDWIAESLGISPDGKRLVLSESERVFSLMIAEGVPGLGRPKGGAR